MTEFYSKDFYEKNYMSVTASVIDKCNYNCEYCCNSFPRTNEVLDSVKLIDFIAHVKTLTSKTI